MTLLWEGALALLSALGVVLLLTAALQWLLRPLPGGEVWILAPGRGSGEGLEWELWCLDWLQGLGLVRGRVAIVDCGLNEEGQALVKALTRRWPEVTVRQDPGLSALMKPHTSRLVR